MNKALLIGLKDHYKENQKKKLEMLKHPVKNAALIKKLQKEDKRIKKDLRVEIFGIWYFKNN